LNNSPDLEAATGLSDGMKKIVLNNNDNYRATNGIAITEISQKKD